MSQSAIPPDSDRRAVSSLNRPRHRLAAIAAWIVAIATLTALVALVAVAALLNSARFHEYALRTVEAKAAESLGARVELQNFTLHPSTLSVDLYGVTVDGAAPYSNPPLLQVAHAQAGLRIVSILRRTWYLDNFSIDHPVVRIFVDSNGRSNLPKLKSSDNSSNTSVFDLGIRHAVLDHGELFYNDKPSALDVDLHDLEFRASYNSSLNQYKGRLAYSNGNVAYGTLHPVAHSLDAQFEATPSMLRLSQAKLAVDTSQLTLSATVDNYSNPKVDGTYDANIDGSQVARMLKEPSIPVGLLHTSGSFQYQQVQSRSFADTVVVNGNMTSRRLVIKTPSLRAYVDNIDGEYSLANGNALLRSFRANLLGGEVTATAGINRLSGDSQGSANATLHGISLAQLRQVMGPSAAGVALTGALNANARAAWGKTFDDLVAHADVTIDGHAARNQSAPQQVSISGQGTSPGSVVSQSSVPIDSVIHATYSAVNHELTVANSYLRTSQSELTMNGVVSTRSSLNVRLQANDLREFDTIASAFQVQTPGHPVETFGIAGSASFQGNVQGSTLAPHLTGQLTASDLQFRGTSWKSFRTNIELNPSFASLQHADLESASRGQIAFSASTGLSKWSYSNASPIQIQLRASQMNIADLTRLAGQQIPVTGTLTADIALHGTELNPIGTGNVSLTGVTAYDEPIQAVKFTFSGTGDDTHGDLSIQLPAGSLQGKVSVQPKLRTYTAQLSSSGIRLDQLQALKARNIDVAGVLAVNAQGKGSFDNPQLDATLQIPTLVVQKQTVTALNLKMNVADHIANATLQSSALNTTIQGKARVELTGDYLADASLDTQGIPLQPLLAVYAPSQSDKVTGQTEVHAKLHGPLKNRSLLEGHITIPVLKVAYGNTVQLAAAAPVNIDYKNGVMDLQRSSIKGTDTDLEFQGTIPVSGNAPISLLLHGTVDLQLAQLFDPDIRSSGQLRFNINSNGAASGSDLGGEIDIVDASYASPDLPAGMQHGNGVLKLTTDRLYISKFQGNIGGGIVTAQGGVAFRPGVQFDLGLAANGMRILYPEGMRESVDANLRLTGSMENAVLGGSVNLTDVSFTPAFDLASFSEQFSGGVPAPPTRGFAQNLGLNIALHSTNNVNLVSRTLSVGGSANLRIQGTAANPVVMGRVNLNSGDVILNGNRFVLNGGTVQFVNPSETRPVVNLTLTTTIQQYNINLRFDGPVEQLRTQYSSDPSLPSADIINLLAFGQTTEANAANPATPADQAAETLVASQVSSQVTSRVSKIAGISQLSVNPVLAGSSSQGPPGANITIQQRVTGNLFVTFSTNVASTQSQTIQGQYQVSPRVAVSATRDPNGGFAFDTLIKKSW
jgi:translocation and assembly module TamB